MAHDHVSDPLRVGPDLGCFAPGKVFDPVEGRYVTLSELKAREAPDVANEARAGSGFVAVASPNAPVSMIPLRSRGNVLGVETRPERDAELDAVRLIEAVLAGLTATARERVMDFVTARLSDGGRS